MDEKRIEKIRILNGQTLQDLQTTRVLRRPDSIEIIFTHNQTFQRRYARKWHTSVFILQPVLTL